MVHFTFHFFGIENFDFFWKASWIYTWNKCTWLCLKWVLSGMPCSWGVTLDIQTLRFQLGENLFFLILLFLLGIIMQTLMTRMILLELRLGYLQAFRILVIKHLRKFSLCIWRGINNASSKKRGAFSRCKRPLGCILAHLIGH